MAKFLVFLLMALNLIFYALSSGYLGEEAASATNYRDREVAPERIRLVAQTIAPDLSKKTTGQSDQLDDSATVKAVEKDKKNEGASATATATAPPMAALEEEINASINQEKTIGQRNVAVPPVVCRRWERLDAADADRLESLLSQSFRQFQITRRHLLAGNNSWWVYIPASVDRATADKKIDQLHRAGIRESFVVTEGIYKNAVSLGVFSQEKGAHDMIAALKKEQRISTARIMLRPGADGGISLQVSGPGAGVEKMENTARNLLPKTPIVTC